MKEREKRRGRERGGEKKPERRRDVRGAGRWRRHRKSDACRIASRRAKTQLFSTRSFLTSPKRLPIHGKKKNRGALRPCAECCCSMLGPVHQDTSSTAFPRRSICLESRGLMVRGQRAKAERCRGRQSNARGFRKVDESLILTLGGVSHSWLMPRIRP